MQRIISFIDSLNEWIGRAVAWLALAMVLAMCAVVFLRYSFAVGSIKLQESVTWMHALVFLIGAAYTLKHDEHVRVDVFYRGFGPRIRAWVNLLGTLLLLWPLCVLILWSSWDYVLASWHTREASGEVGGLPGVYLLKTAIPVTALLLFLQGLAEALRALQALRGNGGSNAEAAAWK